MRKILLLSVVGLFAVQAYAQQSIPEYCLENDVVHKYLTEVQYDPNDYSKSKIMDYCYSYPWDWEGEGKGVRLDFPKPVTLKLESALGAAGKLYVGESEDYSDADLLVMNVAKGADSVNVWNLIPGRTYNWKLVDAQTSALIKSGKFKTTGSLRMLKIDNVFNVRDMGGWISELNGQPLKYGKIVRGSRLNVNKATTKMITSEGDKELVRIGLRSELDMRDASNSVNAQYAFFGTNYPILNVNQGYRSRIATFADGPQSIQGINQLIAWLKEGKPVYLHCSVGADRTGTVAYLVGALCGMSEDALCKEFELTSFSGDKIDNEAVSNAGNDLKRKYERLIRQRDYTGRLDPNDNNESYKFAKMVDKIKTFPGETLQQKVYYHLKTGVSGTKVSEADLRFLIKEMTGYIMVESVKYDGASKFTMNPGDTQQLTASLLPAGAVGTITFKSSNPAVATVSETGLITAVRGGEAIITFGADGITQKVTVNVPTVESTVPAYALYNGANCNLTGNNRISNGSFEYGSPYYYWTNAKDGDMTAAYFDIKHYENSDSVYLESKVGGDAKSEGSIRNEWKVGKNKNFIFGYRVKNSTDLATVNNENLKVMLTTMGSSDESGAQILKFPSYNSGRTSTMQYPCYDGNWTEIQYVFNSGNNNSLRMVFTNLSADGNNTCLDNFYLAEIDITAGIKSAASEGAHSEIYDLTGRKVDANTKGILIKDGKKFMNK